MSLCITCGLAPRYQRYRRCRNCYEWRRRHGGQERPAAIYAPHERRCAHCTFATPVLTRGLCRACYAYRWRCGRPRPARLYAGGPRRCQNCQTTRRLGGRRCWACKAYWRAHGTERPARLYQRSRCAQCQRCLPLTAPTFQTLCRPCGVRWLRTVQAEEARTA